jgi:hypothetical protein
MPKSFRGEHPDGYPDPASLNQYKPPSVFAEHRGLVIVFAIVFVALAVYCIKSMLVPRASPPPEPIYVQPVQAAPPSAP